ncbi:hypothetical protein BDN70DRAFT_998404 [Pholiota conissans]|uniref:Uncharacterized protein n=1 Tax=Pholiota conissans TaxID=109636 RepID=A0A9P5YN95_9AGAR|nr:hypothetical protein BDN70DRAFT_998404 [Pholiota conissans]
MSHSLSTTILLFFALSQPAYAQITHHRTVSAGRIIAGCIVGGLAIILFFILCAMMMRRRRTGPWNAGNGNQTHYGPKPMFGGPWGRGYGGQTNDSPMGPYTIQGSNYNNYNNGYTTTPQPVPPAHQSPASHNPEYPSPNDPLPPPTYGQDADYGRKYSPPAGPPPTHNTTNHGPFSPPPGPPPAAHVNGQNDQFVGGFRS